MVLTQPLLLQRYYTGFGEAESTNLLSRFNYDALRQLGRSRKRHRICISEIRLNLILDARSAMWRDKAPVSSKEERLQKIPAKHSPGEAYRRKMLSISLLIK